MTFTPADPVSLFFFLAIVALVLGALLAGIHRASVRLRGAARKRTLATAAGVFVWLALVSAVTLSGFAEASPMPRLGIVMAAILGVSAGFGLSPAGGWLAAGLPLSALVGFQAFRLPLELVLHSWASQGTIPGTMTWTGENYDIVTGIVALLAAPLANRHRAAAWLANGVGIVLLGNVVRVVVLSSPLPFAWNVSPPLQLAFHLPYVWIAPVCVGGALAGHLVLTRALLRRS